MEKHINSYPIDRKFTFYDPDLNALNLRDMALILTQKEGEILGCRLKFPVDYQTYSLILEKSLFNLKPEINFSVKTVNFLPENLIDLEVELRPDWLNELCPTGETAENIIDTLLSLEFPSDSSQAYNFTENWYCLSVKQQQETGEVGYKTLWHSIDFGKMSEALSTGNKVIESLSSFIQETTETFASQLESLNSGGENSSENVIQFLEFLERFESNGSQKSESIYEAIKDFFDGEDWNFVELEEESILQMAFQGDNGRWSCYACAFDESEQFAFYSVFPWQVPFEKLLTLAEYLMKANYGLMIGNFELDFTDGEIRYKTSIDVENSRLTPELLHNLVYANVLTMDQYLPGITALLNGKLSTEEALILAENPPENRSKQELNNP